MVPMVMLCLDMQLIKTISLRAITKTYQSVCSTVSSMLWWVSNSNASNHLLQKDISSFNQCYTDNNCETRNYEFIFTHKHKLITCCFNCLWNKISISNLTLDRFIRNENIYSSRIEAIRKYEENFIFYMKLFTVIRSVFQDNGFMDLFVPCLQDVYAYAIKMSNFIHTTISSGLRVFLI